MNRAQVKGLYVFLGRQESAEAASTETEADAGPLAEQAEAAALH